MPNEDQHEFWNEAGGDRWVAHTPRLDLMMAEVTERLLGHADPRPGQHVLDVGCGGGKTSRELARAVGSEGSVLGLDLSRPLLELARRSAGEAYPQLRHEPGDAQTHALERGRCDLALSRFGIMFFEDPVAGLSNIRRALHDQARLTFVCWAPPESNPLFLEARRIAHEHLGPPEAAADDPRAPGPFAFADAAYVDDLLGRAGFSRRQSHRESPRLQMGTLEQAVDMMINLGPASRRMQEVEATPAQHAAIARDLGAFLAQHAASDGFVSLSSDVFFWIAEP